MARAKGDKLTTRQRRFDEESATAPEISATGEISTDDYNDDAFECTCPRCGFKFNK